MHKLLILRCLSFQVFKDDWTRSSTTLQLLNSSARTLYTSPSHSPHYVNVTYPQVYAPPRTPIGNSSSYPPLVYYPNSPRHSPFSPPNATTVPSIPSVSMSSRSSLFSTTKNFAELTSNADKVGVSFNQNHTEKELSSSDPSLYGKSYSEVHRNATVFAAEESEENKIDLQNWKDGKETDIRRDIHNQKPSPYYVNVDFSSRSHVLSNASGSALENSQSTTIASHSLR